MVKLRCTKDACEPKAVDKNGKPLTGAAKASFMKTCFNVRRDPERSDDMGNRKARTSAKPRSATKARSKVKRAKPIVRYNSRAKSKQAAVMALLNRPQGDARRSSPPGLLAVEGQRIFFVRLDCSLPASVFAVPAAHVVEGGRASRASEDAGRLAGNGIFRILGGVRALVDDAR
jgi:hypothetical protein